MPPTPPPAPRRRVARGDGIRMFDAEAEAPRRNGLLYAALAFGLGASIALLASPEAPEASEPAALIALALAASPVLEACRAAAESLLGA